MCIRENDEETHLQTSFPTISHDNVKGVNSGPQSRNSNLIGVKGGDISHLLPQIRKGSLDYVLPQSTASGKYEYDYNYKAYGSSYDYENAYGSNYGDDFYNYYSHEIQSLSKNSVDIGKLIEDIIDTGLFTNVIFITEEATIDLIANITANATVDFTFTSVVLQYDVLALMNFNSGKDFAKIFSSMYHFQLTHDQNSLFLIIPDMDNLLYLEFLVQDIINYIAQATIAIIYSTRQDIKSFFPWINHVKYENVFFFDPQPAQNASGNQNYQLLEICKFCDKGKDEIHLINRWEASSGFEKVLEFPNSFKSKYFNAEFLIAAELHPTNIWITEIEKTLDEEGNVKTTKHYAGPMYEDYKMLSQMLEFTLVINKEIKTSCKPDAEEQWRRVRIQNVSSPDLENLFDGEINAVGGGNLASYEVYQVGDISAPTFYQRGANIVSVEPLKTFRQNAILQPFSWYLWILIIATIPISSGTLHLLRKYSRHPDKNPKFRDSMWDIVSITCWDCVKIRQPNLPIIILLLSHMLAITFLIISYCDYYTSFMTSPSHIRPPIENQKDLWNSNLRWIGGRMKDYYVEYFNSVVHFEDRARYLNVKDIEQEGRVALELMIANPDEYVYFERKGEIEWIGCNYDIDMKGRKIHYSKETIGDYNTYLYFQKGLTSTENFNRKILLLQDMGIILMNQRKFANKAKHSRCFDKIKSVISLIKLSNLMSAFYLLLFGDTIAFLLFIKEILCQFRIKVKFLRMEQIL